MSETLNKGKHDHVKLVAWAYIACCREVDMIWPDGRVKYSRVYPTTKEIAAGAGLNLHSLQTLMGRWLDWNFVRRVGRNANGFYQYGLTNRAYKWLRRNRKKFLREVLDGYDWFLGW